MFGKTRETNEMDTLQDIGVAGEFFGDEAAAEEASSVEVLRDRVEAVESQINSQFTSLATYAQIAQEQVELARAEARAHTERSEQRMTSLVERERADRLTSAASGASVPMPTEVSERLDALEHSVARLMDGLDECLERQKQLADAIATVFDGLGRAECGQPAGQTWPKPAAKSGMLPPPQVSAAAPEGPIAGLSLDV